MDSYCVRSGVRKFIRPLSNKFLVGADVGGLVCVSLRVFCFGSDSFVVN